MSRSYAQRQRRGAAHQARLAFELLEDRIKPVGFGFGYALGMGSAATDGGEGLALDSAGNSLVVGSFRSTVDFDPGPGTANLTSAGVMSAFVAKYDAAGTLIWAQALGGTNSVFGSALAVDVANNVYITGNFVGTADFDPGAGTFNLTAAGGNDGFIVKLDSAGNLLWAMQLGSAGSDFGQAITVDASGNVSVTLNSRTVSTGEAESLVLGGRTSSDTFRLQNLPIIPTELKGDRGNDSVLAPSTVNDWHITTTNGGSLNSSLTINAIENWFGGPDDDTFTFADRKTVAGKIDGGGGADTLDYAAYTAPVAVNLQTRTATGAKTIANITSLLGGLANDKLTGANQSNAWSLTGNNAGDVNGVVFVGFENLTGGTLDDAFTFADGSAVTGKIDSGAGADVLDYSGWAASVAINLQARSATATGGVVNFERFLGGTGTDTLIAANTTNRWNFTSSGAGLLNRMTFNDFENFTGGSSIDTFTLTASLADWLGDLNGGAGNDSLYAFAAGVNLWTNGATGAGTLNGRAFTGIEFRR